MNEATQRVRRIRKLELGLSLPSVNAGTWCLGVLGYEINVARRLKL